MPVQTNNTSWPLASPMGKPGPSGGVTSTSLPSVSVASASDTPAPRRIR